MSEFSNLDQQIKKMESGSIRALARLITRVENSDELGQYIISKLYAKTGKSHVIGVTGAPGSGKSSLVTELALVLRKTKSNCRHSRG